MSEHPYPGYNIIEKWHSPSFNDQTRRVLYHRLNEVPNRRFFSEHEWAVLEAFCDTVVPQPGRANKVPIAPWIDAAMVAGQSSGTRYADMPADAEAWQRGLAAFDAEADRRHDQGFSELLPHQRAAIVKAATRAELLGPEWGNMPPKRFTCDFALKQVVQLYYVHPVGMSEIGFGGPASPRGYVRLDANRFDAWEAPAGHWRTREAAE